jgi:hypothetical protein
MHRYLTHVLLLVIPCLWFVVWGLARDAAGPFWIERDPEYSYLMDSLNVATGHVAGPHLLVHPGATLQVWCAAVTRCTGWLRGAENLPHDVVRYPELYLTLQLTTLMALFALLLCAVGVVTMRLCGSVLAALAVQATPLAMLPLTLYARKLYCEPMLMLAGMALVGALVACLRDIPQRRYWTATLVCIAVCGSGLATKFNFAPLLLIPLCVLPGVRWRLLFIAGVVAVFVAWTVPILWPHYRELMALCWANIAHPRQFGTGEAGIGNLRDIVAFARRMFAEYPLYFPTMLGVTLGALGLSVHWFALRLRTNAAARVTAQRIGLPLRTVWALLLVQLLTAFIVARRETFLYYMPAAQLLGATVVLLGYSGLQCVAHIRPAQPAMRVLLRALPLVVYGAAAALMLATVLRQVAPTRHILAVWQSRTAATLAHCRAVEQRFPNATFLHLWSLAPVDALQFGNDNSDGRYAAVLREVFPDAIFYDPRRAEGHRYHHFARDLAENDLAQRCSNLVYRSTVIGIWANALPPLPLQQVLSAADEQVFTLTQPEW